MPFEFAKLLIILVITKSYAVFFLFFIYLASSLLSFFAAFSPF